MDIDTVTALLLGYGVALVGVLFHWWFVTGQEMSWMDVARLKTLSEAHLRARAESVKRTQRLRRIAAFPLLAVGVLLLPFGIWYAVAGSHSLNTFLLGFLTWTALGAGVQFYWWTRVDPRVNPFAVHLGDFPPGP